MTHQTEALLKRRLELDDALVAAQREVNAIQAQLTLARRRVKAAKKAYDESCRAYFAALDEARRGTS